MGRFILRVILGFVLLICTHAAFLVAHAAGWFPDQQLAGLLIASPNILQIEAVRWTLTAIFALLIWSAADYFLYRRHGRKNNGPHQALGDNEGLRKNGEISLLAEFIPDVRVADSLTAQRIFEGQDGDKLIPLLEAEKIFAWARPVGRGEPPPIRIPGGTWRTNQLWCMPKGDNPHMRNQTFIKSKTGSETIYFDLFLNRGQIRRVWPNFESKNDIEVSLNSSAAKIVAISL